VCLTLCLFPKKTEGVIDQLFYLFLGKLRDELLNREIFTTLTEARVSIDGWRKEYNQVRPHSALGHRPPAPGAVMPVTLT